jgi:light-harvesting protein B-800-850 alpha chain
MVNGKMWLVVKPTVFIPIMFVAIIVSALSIHTALLIFTDYYPSFLKGRPRGAANLVMPSDVPALAAVQFTAPAAG